MKHTGLEDGDTGRQPRSYTSSPDILNATHLRGDRRVTDLDKRRVLEHLTDLTEAAIGELPFQIVDIIQIKTDFRFTLEHVTDGEVEFNLPVQVIYLHDGVVQIMMDREIEHILDMMWGRC